MEDSPEFRIAMLEREQKVVAEAVKQISSSLQQLVKLEQHHQETRNSLERAFREIEAIHKETTQQEIRISLLERAIPNDFDNRFRAIENTMPGLKETRKWVIAGVLGIVATVGMALLGVAIVHEDGNRHEQLEPQPAINEPETRTRNPRER